MVIDQDPDWWWQQSDPKGWLDMLYEDFYLDQDHKIDITPQGLIVKSDYVQNRKARMFQIRMPFVQVEGSFSLVGCSLESLKNSPRIVTERFIVNNNRLSSLQHGPEQVGMDYECSDNLLTDLQGLPSHINRYLHVHNNPLQSLEGLSSGITYLTITNSLNHDLPLLRTLTVQGRVAVEDPQTDRWDNTLNEILNDPRWHGKGKVGMLNCALALKQAGYGGNAKW